MRPNSFLLSSLSMGLLYFSLYLGMMVINLRGVLREGRLDLGVFVHYALVIVSGLGLYGVLRWGARRLGLGALVLAVIAVACLSIPFWPPELFRPVFSGRPPLIAVIQAIFIPVGFWAFARLAPGGQEGFAFAVLVAACELLWAMFFPLFTFISPAAAGQEAIYLFSLDCWTLGGAGLCLGAIVLSRRKQPEPLASSWPGPEGRAGWAAFGLITAAYGGVMVAIGLYMGLYMPKMSLNSGPIDIPYFASMFFLPWLGKLFDRQPAGLARAMSLVFPILFVLGLLLYYGAGSLLALYFFLHVLQAILNMAAYAGAAKVFKRRPALAFFLVVVYSLLPVQSLGLLLRTITLHSPFAFNLAALIVLGGSALCLWRFRCLLTGAPELWAAPPTENQPPAPGAEMAASVPEPDLHKLSTFAAAHGLTAREREVLVMLVCGGSREAMAAELGLTMRTVRYHLSNLQKKTAMPNEMTLIDYYRSWANS